MAYGAQVKLSNPDETEGLLVFLAIIIFLGLAIVWIIKDLGSTAEGILAAIAKLPGQIGSSSGSGISSLFKSLFGWLMPSGGSSGSGATSSQSDSGGNTASSGSGGTTIGQVAANWFSWNYWFGPTSSGNSGSTTDNSNSDGS